MLGAGRPSSLLPSIKCSNCNVDIEISRMADHVCDDAQDATLRPNQYLRGEHNVTTDAAERANYNRYTISDEALEQTPSNPYQKGRNLLTRIDSTAANQPFRRYNTLDPGLNSTGDRITSTLAALDGRKSPFTPPLRSATSPLPRISRPLSSGISNLDCAFPPILMGPASGRKTPTGTRTPLENQFEASQDHIYDESDPMYRPMSSRRTGGGTVLKRMNTIAPGPFGLSGRRNGDSDTRTGGMEFVPVQRTVTLGVAKSHTNPPSATASNFVAHFRRPSTAASENSQSSFEGADGQKAIHRRAPTLANGTMASRPGTAQGAEIRKPSISSITVDVTVDPTHLERSGNLPASTMARDLEVLPLPRRPTNTAASSTSHPPPPLPSSSTAVTGISSASTLAQENERTEGCLMHSRSRNGSRAGPQPDFELEEEPTVPSITHQHQTPRTLHTPTESQSSNGSGYWSETRTGSSRSTPPLPEASDKIIRRRPASPALEAGPTRLQDPHENRHALNPDKGFGVLDKPLVHREAQKFACDTSRQNDSLNTASHGGLKDHHMMEPISRAQHRPLPPRVDVSSGRRPGTTPSKGKCRGCGEFILGKSVSSADGRLTGRYHKQCFVCRTCKQPFETATFYVIDNQPYCERHYHQLNDSICQACDHGIEGQYLGTGKKQKYHPDCFKCSDCRKTLRDEYFELNGKAYCEQHAIRRADKASLLGPGRRYPERRTTRLMMM